MLHKWTEIEHVAEASAYGHDGSRFVRPFWKVEVLEEMSSFDESSYCSSGVVQ